MSINYQKNTGKKGKPNKAHFKPGQSGNPAGRPKGSRNKISRLVEDFSHEHVEMLLGIAMAYVQMNNDSAMLRFLLERMTPPHWLPPAEPLEELEQASAAAPV